MIKHQGKLGNKNAKKDITAKSNIHIRVTQDKKDQYKLLADARGQSLSELVIILLENEINQ